MPEAEQSKRGQGERGVTILASEVPAIKINSPEELARPNSALNSRASAPRLPVSPLGEPSRQNRGRSAGRNH